MKTSLDLSKVRLYVLVALALLFISALRPFTIIDAGERGVVTRLGAFDFDCFLISDGT
jgi:regulator of protease activity HflC (stomatin/prohibitin superfamily)